MAYRRIAALLGALILLGILLVPPGATAQDGRPDIQLSAQPFFDGSYRPGSWLPVRLTVANNGPDVRAKVAVDVGSIFEAALELPRGANKTLVLYVLPTGGFRRTGVARVSVDGKEAAHADMRLAALTQNALVAAVFAEQPPTLPLPRSKPQAHEETVRLRADELPTRREGLSAFGVIVLDAPPAGFGAEQGLALADWVRTGGQLVVGGNRLAQTLVLLPPELRAATAAEAAPRGPNSLLPELEDATPEALSLAPAAGARAIGTAGDAVVAVQHELGNGSITVLGWGLSAPELAQLPPQPVFWQRVLRPSAESTPMPGMLRLEDQQLQQLTMALMTLPVLANPPFGVLIGLLAAYILVIGPGLYLLLRKLDRQVWGWAAIPLITVLFALGAYGYGMRIRGNDIILNEVSIVEPLGGRSRVRLLAGIFSPRTDTYAVRAAPDALFRPMGSAEFGGMPAMTVGGRFDQGAGIEGLEVAQWSMNSFAAEQMIDGQPLSAELTLAGNVLRGTIRNTGSAALRDVALFHGQRVAKVGDLEPGQSKDVELKLGGAVANWGGSLSMLLLNDQWDFNQPRAVPADIRIKQSVLDALFSVPQARQARPTVVGWLDHPPVPLALDHGRVLPQQTALVTLPVEARYEAGAPIEVPRGWVTPRTEVSQNNGGGPCMSQFGSGWYIDTGVMTSTLQLPPALRSLAVDEATVYVQPEGAMPSNIKVELLDWSSGAWIDQGKPRNTLKLEDPRRFFDEAGALKLRVDLKNAMQGGAGCIATDLSLKGTQPEE